MKKKKIISMFLLAITIAGFLNGIFSQTVEATTSVNLVQTAIDDVYYTKRGGSEGYSSYQYYAYTMNGKTVYCIEPGTAVSSSDYTDYDGLIASPYDDGTNKLLELIGHYGYDYPGRQHIRFRMATQALIWETVGGSIVEYWTEQYGNGSYINIDYEKSVIMTSVNKHYSRPSFDFTNVETVIGKELAINDTNGVLEDYEIYGGSIPNVTARIEGNTLYLTPHTVGTIQIRLNRKHYDSNTTIVFHGNDNVSQKMGYFRFKDPVVSSLNLKSIGGKITITKNDFDLKTTKPLGDATLVGAVYDVYDSSNNVVDTLTIDSNFKATTKELPLGTYLIKERNPSLGYTLDKTSYSAIITESNLNTNSNVYEKVIERNINFYKVFATNETGILTGEPNITFKFILKSSGEEYARATTDSGGFLSVKLPYGTYTVIQENTTPNYEKVDDFEITINENSKDPMYYLLGNAERTARIKVIKVDEDNNLIARAGIKFRIKNIDTNTYVEQTIAYPIKQTISIFETASDGTILTPYPLTTGNYQLEEVEDQFIYGFTWNSKPLLFSVGDDSDFKYHKDYGNVIELRFINKAVYGEFTFEKLGEKLIKEDNSYHYEEISLTNVEANIYANEDIYYLDTLIYKKGDLVTTIKPNETVKLYLGKYCLVETKTEEGHVLNATPQCFEITQTNQYEEIIKYSLELKNYLKKGTLDFTKIDLVTGEALTNTKIQIYTENDELIFEGITNENGKIVIDNLFVGKFYIIEIEAPEGYILNTEKLWFEITDDGEIIKCELPNEKIIEIPNTGIVDYHILEIASGFIILLGIGVVIYAIKRKKK